MESIWKDTVELPERQALQKDIQVQTVVIGAGLAGILTAYFLKKRGREVVVVEAKSIASGQSGRTTAKITGQHGLLYDKLLHKVGWDRARAYARANMEAIQMYEKLIEEESINCHFEKRPAYLYTLCKEGLLELQKEAEAARALGYDACFVEGSRITELPFEVKGAVCFKNQAQFHPVEFIKGLADKLDIYEDTKVLSVSGHKVFTNKGTIKAENIVFATHYPIINIPGFYFLRQHQERSYVLALKGQKELGGMYYSIDEDGLSIRSAGDILLLGGGGHRTGKKMKKACQCGENVSEIVSASEKTKQIGYTFLRSKAQEYYSDAEELAAWAAQDCMPHDDIPLIGRYSIFRPYWYVATGFKKWGMTSAMISATVISQQICGGPSPYGNAFSPQRFLFRAAIKNLMVDMGESIQGLGKGIFSKRQQRCTHMGCKLEWNEEEATWDCPCHGSRFKEEGELLDNPAKIDLVECEKILK